MFEVILEDIKAYNRIILHRHKNPDGDALGSQIGLKHLILENFPGKEVYMVGDAPGRYGFMAGSVMDEISDECFKGALSILLDFSSPELVSDDRYKLSDKTARIDHHLSLSKFADDEAIDSTYESCCGLVTNMARECGWKLNTEAATALYTGMVTDSGRFRYDSTNSRTFELASYLLTCPVDTQTIFSNLYSDDFEAVKRKALFVLKIQFSEHNVAYIYNTAKEVEELNMSTFAVSRGMVGCMADIKGVDIWVNFTEAPEGVLCEIRSSCYNINPIAVKYGGGGHAKASGATIADKETAMKMLRDLDEMAAGGNNN